VVKIKKATTTTTTTTTTPQQITEPETETSKPETETIKPEKEISKPETEEQIDIIPAGAEDDTATKPRKAFVAAKADVSAEALPAQPAQLPEAAEVEQLRRDKSPGVNVIKLFFYLADILNKYAIMLSLESQTA